MGQWLPDTIESSYNKYVAGPADHAAGTTDEAVGRTFDGTAGGGVVDGTVDAVGDLLMERPASHQGTDSWDIPGPNIDEVAGIEGYRPGGTNADQEPTNRPAWTRYVQLAVVLVVIYVIGQLFTFNIGDSDA